MMNAEKFKEEMKNPKNIYCLVSSDSKMIDLYVKRFKDAIQADQISYGEIRSFGRLFKKKTLNVLYLEKIDESIFNRKDYIFIHTNKIDKRSSVYKNYKDRFIELENDYTQYIVKHSNLTTEQAKQFAMGCKNDLGIIEHTLTLYNDSNVNFKEFIEYLGDIYMWVDCFIKKEPLPIISDSPISILALLSTNCQNILKVKRNNTEDLNPYAIKHIKLLTKYRTEKELANIISMCFYLDSQLKKGLLNIDDILDYLIISTY